MPLIEDMRTYGQRWLFDAAAAADATAPSRRRRRLARPATPLARRGARPGRAKHHAMRDLVVREGLVAMARDAAKCLHELVAAGRGDPV